jgi:hypothetical protein
MPEKILTDKIELCASLFRRLRDEGMNKPDSYVKCYHQKFRDGTGGWTAVEKWAYWSSILWYRSDDCRGLPDDDQSLFIMCECPTADWARIKGKIFGPKFMLINAGWHNERALEYCIEAVDGYISECLRTRAANASNAERRALSNAARNAKRDAGCGVVCNADISTSKRRTFSKEKEKEVVIPGVLNTLDFRAAWDRWAGYRSETRHALTKSTIEAQLKFLEQLGAAAAVETIEKSIRNGWRGLFEPDKNHDNFGNRSIGDGRPVQPVKGSTPNNGF